MPAGTLPAPPHLHCASTFGSVGENETSVAVRDREFDAVHGGWKRPQRCPVPTEGKREENPGNQGQPAQAANKTLPLLASHTAEVAMSPPNAKRHSRKAP